MQKWVMAIITTFCLLGILYNVTIPLFEAPDEIWHFSFIQFLADQRALPVQPSEGKDMWLREAGQPPLYYILAAPFVAQLETDDFPDFVRFNVAHPAITAHSDSDAPNVFIHTRHEAFPYQGAVLAVHIVRLVSLVWGILAILGVYLVAYEIIPQRPKLIVATVAVAAFNPHFIYISSVVNNDAAAAALCTLVLWLVARVVKHRASPRLPSTSWPLGVILGLALLSKVSALALLALVGGGLALMWLRDRDWGAFFLRSLVVFGLAIGVAGWWYARNWILYGDPLAWEVWLIDIGVQRIGIGELLRQFAVVGITFWSPYQGLFPRSILWILGAAFAVVAMGWARLAVRYTKSPSKETNALIREINPDGLLIAGTWFLMLFASLVYYMLTTPAAAGRLLYPGLAAFALLWVLGWSVIIPRRGLPLSLTVLMSGLLLLAVVTPLGAIVPRFAWPVVRAGARELRTLVSVEGDVALDSAHVMGVKIIPDIAQQGDTVKALLYWKVSETPSDELRAAVRLWTVSRRLVGQRDMTPAEEVYPPDMWREGDIVRATYRVPIDLSGPAMCQVSVKIMDGDTSLGEVWSPVALRLRGGPLPQEKIIYPVQYILDDKIQLMGYDVPEHLPEPGTPMTVTLYWRALAKMQEDYTVFVHLLGAGDTQYGQGDGPPLNNDYPTSYWKPGDTLEDAHTVWVNEHLNDEVYLAVGMYRLSDLTRLPAYDATGTRVPNDAIELSLQP